MELLSLLFADITKIFWKFIQMTVEEVSLDAHIKAKVTETENVFFDNILLIICLVISREILHFPGRIFYPIHGCDDRRIL